MIKIFRLREKFQPRKQILQLACQIWEAFLSSLL